MLTRLTPWAVPMVLRNPEDDGTAGGTGGGSGGDPGKSGDADKGDQTVPLAKHKETLDKFHEVNTRAKTLETQLAELKKTLKDKETKHSEVNGDFKALYESTKAEKEALESKYDGFRTSVFNDKKIDALTSELKGKGLKPGHENLIDFVDLEKMPHETTSKGRILVHGAAELAAELAAKYPMAFQAKTVPKTNGGGTGGGNQDTHTDVSDDQLTAQFMVALETKDPKKYKELYPRYVKVYQARTAKGG